MPKSKPADLQLVGQSRGRFGVTFTAGGLVLGTIYFDTEEAAKAHAESFMAPGAFRGRLVPEGAKEDEPRSG